MQDYQKLFNDKLGEALNKRLKNIPFVGDHISKGLLFSALSHFTPDMLGCSVDEYENVVTLAIGRGLSQTKPTMPTVWIALQVIKSATPHQLNIGVSEYSAFRRGIEKINDQWNAIADPLRNEVFDATEKEVNDIIRADQKKAGILKPVPLPKKTIHLGK